MQKSISYKERSMKTITHDALMEMLESEDLVSDRMIKLAPRTVVHEVIFAFKGCFYRTYYQEPVVENQPWETEDHKCTRVFPFDKTIQEYKDNCTRLKDLQDGEWFRLEESLHRRLSLTDSHYILCYNDDKCCTRRLNDHLVVTLVRVDVGEIKDA